jgi:flagellar transcriptional activator FlhD
MKKSSEDNLTVAGNGFEKLFEEIRETNLSYLMLAQNLIREDREQALYRLGISGETADLIASLTPGQLLKIAASNLLMCRFRFDDRIIWNLLTGHSRDRAAGAAHASILMTRDYAMAA